MGMSAFHDLKKYYKGLILVFFLTMANAIGELILPFLLSQIVNEGISQGDIQTVLRIGFIMLIVTLLTVTVRSSASYFSAKNSMGFSHDLRNRLFKKVNDLTFDETEFFGISSLITRTTNDVDAVEQFTLLAQRPLLRAPLGFFGGLVMAFLAHRRLTLIVLTSLPIIFVIIYFIVQKVLPDFPKLQRALDRINLQMRQRLTGLKVTRAFNQNEYEKEEFSNANDNYYGYSIRINNILRTTRPLMASIVGITIVLAVFVGTGFILDGSLQVGTLMAFIQYTTQMLNSLVMFANLLTIFPRTTTSVKRVEEVLNYPSRKVGGDKHLEHNISSIEAKDLAFSYPGSQKNVLEAINFNVEKGEVLGVIGGTGSGKSTLLKLLMQFYDPTSGELLVNDVSIEELEPAAVRSELSYVPQQNFFFTNTLRENIYYANPTIPDEEVHDYLLITDARDFLPEEKPLESHMSRGGGNFSGGQQQRLALTRALSRDASVYVFDDSFSALDYQTDYTIRKNLQDTLDQAITIVVAQRVATIRHADKILVLEDGKMAGYGNHEMLMKSNQVYQEIARSQAQGEEDLHDI
jgi:ATP-binding cassette subfamily B protein